MTREVSRRGGASVEDASFAPTPSLSGIEAVSFDLFGTLVRVDPPEAPASAIAAALSARGIAVPDDWAAAYAEPHVDVPEGAECPLHEHVAAALASRTDGLDPRDCIDDVAATVDAAFDTPVRTIDGAASTVATLSERLPVGVLSNCSVPGLVGRTLARSAVDESAFDSVTTSVDCGWRKPHPGAFRAVADDLGVSLERLLHVGDDPTADGGATDAGAAVCLVDAVDLESLPAMVDGGVPP